MRWYPERQDLTRIVDRPAVWYERMNDGIGNRTRESDQGMATHWKLELIETSNPEWRDLFPDIID